MTEMYPSNSTQEPSGRGVHHDHETAPEHPPASGRHASLVLIVAGLVVVGLAAYGIWRRHNDSEVLADTTRAAAAPVVIAMKPTPGAAVDTFVLPGNVTAYTDSPIYARTSGYLMKWYYDIGARVKEGALLAVIASPEVDQQVTQAQADLLTAEANANNAQVQANRYKGLVTADAVSRQDTETFETQAASTSSAVKSAQANLDRLKQLQGFERIYAPFDGVVTARGVDVGQLINQGASNELFHMQAVTTLRVYTNVPEAYSASVKRGEKIPLSLSEYPGKMFEGTLVRTADAIDPANRTLLVEIDVDNRKGELMPGALAQVHFRAPQIGQTFMVPASALIFRSHGLRIGTVVNGNVAHLIPITIGQDDGATVQVITGLNANDRVIQDPPDSLIEGEKLNVESPKQQAQQESTQPGRNGFMSPNRGGSKVNGGK